MRYTDLNHRSTWSRLSRLPLSLLLITPVACATAGSAWMEEPLIPGDGDLSGAPPEPHQSTPSPPPRGVSARTLGAPEQRQPGDPVDVSKLEGRVLGTFRNTYYDFPSEADYKGDAVALKDAQCRTIANVPKEFHDRVCVQGSGTLLSGQTVSFNRRDCECASVCPRTNQKICFDALSSQEFPWGRGATGGPISPLLTIAADTSVLPFGTSVYVPEYEGMPVDEQGTRHDGCFLVQDRGSQVKGKHIDVFTGQEAVTREWNSLVPSNQGVTVVLDSPKCQRAAVPVLPAPERRDRRGD
ncbi:MAG: hypothetical protein KIT72_18200 [Polyangiaceae bacterium]|nr:hypothetical protein [Polyangiaceae bacterium]MCW5792349.1 hypothetical protein [Polyangiaceae bacterium]